MTFSDRMVAGSLGGMLLTVGGRLAWLLGWEAVVMALSALVLILLGGICLFGAITLGESDGR